MSDTDYDRGPSTARALVRFLLRAQKGPSELRHRLHRARSMRRILEAVVRPSRPRKVPYIPALSSQRPISGLCTVNIKHEPIALLARISFMRGCLVCAHEEGRPHASHGYGATRCAWSVSAARRYRINASEGHVHVRKRREQQSSITNTYTTKHWALQETAQNLSWRLNYDHALSQTFPTCQYTE